MLHERFPQVPRIALTATADALTRQEIAERPALQDARVFLSSFDRPNIRYRIVEKDNARQQLLAFIKAEHANADGTHDSGIIYRLSRKKVEETAARSAPRASRPCLTTPAWMRNCAHSIRRASAWRKGS